MIEFLELPRGLLLPVREIEVRSTRSGGPGGQHVNRTESAVILRWAVASSSLPEVERQRLLRRLASRLTRDGELVLRCETHRERGRNLATALERMQDLLTEALTLRKTRRATRPSRSSVRRRLDSKRRRSSVKKDRGRPPRDD